MRPLQLHISGLNSFREKTTIDFEKLLQHGLFGIFGPTGSGKSTILDAITLALYGKVRRAPGGMQGIINMSEQRCSVSLTFEVGYSGTRQRYTIDRLFARNKGGGIETKKARISEYRDGVPIPITEKKNELKEKVEEILGINVDDFLRAVVLPQGAFAEFLGLEPRERSGVMQRLFGLHHYGDRITVLLKGRQEELGKGLAEIEGRLAELRAYDDTALAAVTRDVDELTGAQSLARAAHEDARKHYEDGAGLHARLVEYRELMGEEEERALDARTLDGLRDRIARAERCSMVRPAIDARAGADRRRHATSDRYARARAEEDAAHARVAVARNDLDDAAREYPERYDRLCGELGRLEAIRKLQQDLLERKHELRRLDRDLAASIAGFEEQEALHDAARRALRGVEEEIERIERAIDAVKVSADERDRMRRLIAMVDALREQAKEIEDREAERAVIERKMEIVIAALGGANATEVEAADTLHRLREQRTALDAAIVEGVAERERLMLHGRELAHTLGEIEVVEHAIAADERALRSVREQASGQRKNLVEVRIHLSEAISIERLALHNRDEARDFREETYRTHALALLLPHLHDGEPCPLCGSSEHPSLYRPDSDTTRELATIDGELARAEDRLQSAEVNTRDLERQLAVAESSLEMSEEREATLEMNIGEGAASIARLLEEMTEPCASADNLRERIEVIAREERSVKERADVGQRELKVLMKEIERIDVIRNSAAQRRAGLEAESSGERERCRELDAQASALRLRSERTHQEFTTLATGSSSDDIQTRMEEIRQGDMEAEGLAGKLAELREERQRGERNMEGAQEALNNARLRKERLELEYRMASDAIARMEGERSEQIAGMIEITETEEILRLVEARTAERDRIQLTYERARSAYDDAHATARVASGAVESYRSELRRDEESYELLDRGCSALLDQHGFASVTEVLDGELAVEELGMLRADADRIVRQLDEARRRLAELREKIEGREISDEELLLLNGERTTAGQTEEEATLALGGAREKLRECIEKNAEWKRISMHESQSAGTLATMEQLAKYLRANGFVDYLANERLAEICRHASKQLEELTAGRLEIGARANDGFYIRDYGNGGAERSPSSLSGGETFLVSLSLALALSDTIQLGRAPLEFFFLDEGFGTLDSDLLETVMTSLDKLRSQQRAIGVISHVAQLREWMPRRLIVSPANEQRGATVRYEVA